MKKFLSSRRGFTRLHSFRRGFTLIELLLVIGIIAILAAIVIVAINPTKQLGDARDAQRRSDVNTILNAIWQFAIDNDGTMPCEGAGTCVDSITRVLGTATSGCALVNATCPAIGAGTIGTSDCLDLSTLANTYVVSIPRDPRADRFNAATTGYYVFTGAGGRVTVTSCYPEQETSITVSR
jgi:type IV pilus assembly protein PilA